MCKCLHIFVCVVIGVVDAAIIGLGTDPNPSTSALTAAGSRFNKKEREAGNEKDLTLSYLSSSDDGIR